MTLKRLLILLILLASVGLLPSRLVSGDDKPRLVIPSQSVRGDERGSLSLLFAGNGHAISAMTFALEYDPAILAIDLSAAAFSLPAGFVGSAKADPNGAAKIEVSIFTFSAHSLPNGPVLSLPFQPLCPENADWLETDIRFSARPRASFGNPQGEDVPGATKDGHLSIWCSADPLPTPTPTATATATPTATPTPPAALFDLRAEAEEGEEFSAGEVISFSLTLQPNGDQPLTQVQLSSEIPPEVSVEEVSFSLNRPRQATDTRLHWKLDALYPGERLEIALSLRPALSWRGPLTVTALLNSDQTGPVLIQRVAQISPGPGGVGARPTTLFLPLLRQRVEAVGASPQRLPDLVVEAIVLVEGWPVVTITNRGDSPVDSGFWVDLYVDPLAPPERVNQLWHEVTTVGAAWGVDAQFLPLLPGASIRLELGSLAYSPAHSHLPSALNSYQRLFAQADSWNPATTYGAVAERDEQPGQQYNNITALPSPGRENDRGATTTPALPTTGMTSFGVLPPRPAP